MICSISPMSGSSSAMSIFLRMEFFFFPQWRWRTGLRWWCAWDGKEEGRASTYTAFCPHPSPLPLHDLCRNKKAKAKAWEGLVLRVTHSEKAFKDLFEFLGSNADAKILHADGGGMRIRRKLYFDGVGVGRIFYGIREHVVDHLAQAFAITGYQQLRYSLNAKLVSVSGIAQIFDGLSHENRQVKVLFVPGQFACLYSRHVEQLVDQVDESVELPIHLRQ